MSQTLLIVVTDLLFQARITDAARTLGAEPRVIDGAEQLAAALDTDASAAVIDLHERSLDGLDAVGAVAARGHRVLAFGRHTEPGLLRDARGAGATVVVPRSQLVDELESLLRSILDPAAAEEP